MTKKAIVQFALLMPAILFLYCTLNPVSKGGTDTGNAALSGRLIDGRDGLAAKGATVRVYQVYLNKMAKALGKEATGAPAIDSTRTDSAGYYRLDSLDQGIYNVLAELIDGADTLTMRHASVVFIASKYLGADTLLLPGSIRGTVIVLSNETPKNITCYIPGTSYLAITNDTGGFRITGIPAGVYSLSFTSAKFNDSTIYGIQVASSRETDAGYIALGLNRSKNEHDVWGVFDTTYNCKPIDSIEARVSGDSIPPNSPRIYKLDWRPTLSGYSGFIYVPDNGFFWTIDIWVFDTLGRRTGAYRVSTINRATGDVEVPKFNPFNSVPVITMHDTTVSINDTIRLRPVITTLSDDSIVSMAWKIGAANAFTGTANKDTFIVAPKQSCVIPCIFKVVDKFGNIAVDTVADSVITDSPVLVLGSDTTVDVGSSLTFTADVQQRFGSIVTYTWSIHGDTAWIDSGKQQTKIITFKHSGEQHLVCKVKDDDGNVTADSVNVMVITVIGGTLPLNTVLRESENPFRIKADLVVPLGGTLTIEAGASVLIDPGIKLTVLGSLRAQGTGLKKIQLFATDSLNPWEIQLGGGCCKLTNCLAMYGNIGTNENYSPDSITLDSCGFSNTNMDMGSLVDAKNWSVRNCIFQQCWVSLSGNNCWSIEGNNFISGQDVSVWGNTVVRANHFSGGGSLMCSQGGTIANNIIENSGTGIYIGTTATVSGNRISNCQSYGIFIGGANIHVSNNTITGCGFGSMSPSFPYLNAGIVSTMGFSTIDSNLIADNSIGVICIWDDTLTNNNICNNRYYNFRGLGNLSGDDITAPNNWWGTADTAQIQMKIYDFNDDPGVGRLLIDPIAIDSIPGAGVR